MQTRILVADRHEMFREVLKRLLETEPDFTVVAETGDGELLPQLVSQYNPDVVLFDLKLRKRSGIDALREIMSADPGIKAIALTDSIDQDEIIQLLLLGIRGLVRKDAPSSLLFKSIRTVMGGQYWISHDGVAGLVHNLRLLSAATEQNARQQIQSLTAQQLRILTSIVSGCSNREIAEELSLSERTVKYHLTRIFEIFGVSGRMELARFSLQNKIVREA